MIRNPHVGALCALLAALLMCSPAAWALGLGNASVQSYLNEPLRAQIEMIVREGDDLSTMTASLASVDDFALIGANREAISVPLRFAIEQTTTGAVISVTSTLPVKDPVIRLIVEVNWASGRMLREYTLFLDPPVFSAPAPAPVIDDRRTGRAEPSAETAPEVSTAPAEDLPASADADAPAQQATAEAGSAEYGPVQTGDTLWRIASNWSAGSGQDVNSVMLAIQRNNPGAFINENINLLKRGAILRMPQQNEISEISPSTARSEVTAQNLAIGQGPVEQDTMAPAVETPLVADDSLSPTDADADEPEVAEDKLELVPPSEATSEESTYGFEEGAKESTTATTQVQTLREELARKEEELIIEQQQNQYLKDRISELEGQVTTEQSGTISSPSMAQVEQDLKEKRLAEGAEEVPGTAPEGTAVEQPAAAAAPAKQPAATPARAGARKPEPAWYESIWVWLVGLAIVVVGVVAWTFTRRKSADVIVSDLGPEEKATVRTIKDEAETILRVLKPEAGSSTTTPTETATTGEPLSATRPGKLIDHEEAELLDEDSADPEIRLDLARAYIAMGDREAARAILDEVIEHGSAEQASEAKAMLGEL